MSAEIKNVQITSTFIGMGDKPGKFIYALHFTDGLKELKTDTEDLRYITKQMCQELGFLSLERPLEKVEHLKAIISCLTPSVPAITGAWRWEDLKGRHCRVDVIDGEVKGVGHAAEERWFYPDSTDPRLVRI